MKKANPFVIVSEQYRHLKEKLESTHNVQEKNVIFRRLINLLGVMEFLISTNKNFH
jgi:hypothetical protein